MRDDIVTRDVTWERARAIAEAFFGQPAEVVRLPGGLVHLVYAIAPTAGGPRSILKIRSSVYAEIPSLACQPMEITREVEALRLLNNTAVQERVPRLLHENSREGYFIATEVAARGVSLLDFLVTLRHVPEDMARCLGAVLGSCHMATIEATPWKGNGVLLDRELDLRVLRWDLPVLRRVARVVREGPREFVLGDRSPKNVLLDDARELFFVDFDAAHFGSRTWEVAYAGAHLALHSAAFGQEPTQVHRAFLAGYRAQETPELDHSIYGGCLAATILYRLFNQVIPYCVGIGTDQQSELLAYLERSGCEDVLDEEAVLAAVWKCTPDVQVRRE